MCIATEQSLGTCASSATMARTLSTCPWPGCTATRHETQPHETQPRDLIRWRELIRHCAGVRQWSCGCRTSWWMTFGASAMSFLETATLPAALACPIWSGALASSSVRPPPPLRTFLTPQHVHLCMQPSP